MLMLHLAVPMAIGESQFALNKEGGVLFSNWAPHPRAAHRVKLSKPDENSIETQPDHSLNGSRPHHDLA